MNTLKIQKIIRHPLFLPMLIGFLLRLASIPFTNHIFYPDELFQSLEQSYRLVYGQGIIPWDIAYGLRSYYPILIGAIPLYLLKIIGITSPAIYLPITKAFLALISLSLIYFAYHFTLNLSKNKSAALYAAYAAALWYELIYFSSRLFSETLAAACLLFGLALLIRQSQKHTSAFFLATLGIIIRPQYAPLSLLFLPFLSSKSTRRQSVFGIILALACTALLDIWSHGIPFMPIINNLKLSFQSGISEIFGTKPWWFYLTSSIIASAGIWIIALWSQLNKKTKPVWLTLIILISIHSMIAHKEYRFLFITIPFFISLSTLGLFRLLSNYPFTKKIMIPIFILVSALGISANIPSQARVYGQPLLTTDPMLQIYTTLHRDPTLCGLFDASRNWVYTPAYTYLNRPIPIYSADYPPPTTQAISHYIYPKPQLDITGFSPIFTTPDYTTNINGRLTTLPGYVIYQKTPITPCQPDPDYSSYRSFPAVESVLEQMSAAPILIK